MAPQNFYLFDIDDNILSLPTEVHLYVSELKKKHVEMTTEEFAKNADFIEKLELYEFRPSTSFENMSDQEGVDVEEQQLIQDIKKCIWQKPVDGKYEWQGPCWEIFKNAVDNGNPVSFVTARSHSAETIKAGMALFTEAGFLSKEINYAGVYPVNNPETKKHLSNGEEHVPVPELKTRAIREVVAQGLEKYGTTLSHNFGMSDDDQHNIEGILKAMRGLKVEHQNCRFFVVNSGLGIGPMVKTEIVQPFTAEPCTFIYDVNDIVDNDDMPKKVKPLYKNRDYVTDGKISCNAIGGAKVVMLGFDASDEGREGLLGFAVKKIDVTSKQEFWLGPKVEVDMGEAGGADDEKKELRIIQKFLWNDYMAYSGHNYTYRITPLYIGEGNQKKWGSSIEVHVKTQGNVINNEVKKDAVFFNRANSGSQGYIARFGDGPIDELSEEKNKEAYEWLSNGLIQAMKDVLNLATDKSYAIRGAVYEFSFEPLVQEFKNAHDRGVDVKICFHRHDKADDVSVATLKVMEKVGLGPIGEIKDGDFTDEDVAGLQCIPISHGPIHHNKFVMLLKDNKPYALWTGSTNWTLGALCGHSNVGHLTYNEVLLDQFHQYWNHLCHNKTPSHKKDDNEAVSPFNPDKPIGQYQSVFSPRHSLQVLFDYGAFIVNAKGPVFLTLPFGVTKEMYEFLVKETKHPKFILVDNAYGAHGKTERFLEVKKTPNNYVALGEYLKEDHGDNWHEEHLSGLNSHVKFIHTKFLLIDPLGPEPLIVTGSANFSASSTDKNDENMIVIRTNPDVAQIYVNDFMRFFEHFELRNKVNAGAPVPEFLLGDGWTKPYYKQHSEEYMKRSTFSIPSGVEE